MKPTDVIVVGGGPAGSIAALALARAGVRVRLLERARFPRAKLCGDTLNPGAMAILDRLGLASAVRERALRVPGMLVTGPGGARVVGDYGGPCGAAITRRDLDVVLLDAARAAGADVEEHVDVRGATLADGRVNGVHTTASRGDGRMPARVVIAADGRHSRLSFGLGLSRLAAAPRRWAFGAYYAGVAGLTARGEMHIRRGGYIGIAPVPGGLANVCVVRAWQRGVTPPLRGTLVDEALAADPALRERFASAERVGGVTAMGPLAVEGLAAGMPGLLLAGDSAGFIDPMTGDGLRFAIRGAELAAAAALRELETGQPAFVALARARRDEFAGKWRLNRALRAIVASPRAVTAAAAVAACWSAPLRPLVALAGDVAVVRREARRAEIL